MKSSLTLIFIVFLFCLLCACAERREIEELGFVVGAAYDQAPGSGIKGTYQIRLTLKEIYMGRNAIENEQQQMDNLIIMIYFSFDHVDTTNLYETNGFVYQLYTNSLETNSSD
ncbi:hypothetical protein CSW12_30720 (plasmid) [Bacillus cereus]|uniref:hypothetical protein n=1 Tax=Bacillus cereus TaxID=1396 RepID=UPI0009533943|nr:hypothetical protein [Bacillus cereus]AUB67209.1 hypothetical protein CSW12_30720 [Bacillus cereus]OLR26296.1 hypothetical protein BLD50_07705 [Bacillus cereus]